MDMQCGFLIMYKSIIWTYSMFIIFGNMKICTCVYRSSL